jgi:hypothetical protein
MVITRLYYKGFYDNIRIIWTTLLYALHVIRRLQDLINIELSNSHNKCLEQGKLDSYNLELYANNLLAYYCMPTLVHIKPSNLIQINKRKIKHTEQLILIIENYAKIYGCSCCALYENDVHVSLLIYNKPMLDNVISDKETKYYLTKCGYRMIEDRINDAFNTWKQRYADYYEFKGGNLSFINSKYENIKRTAVFPHEIGLFLGYPIEDVKAFIKYRGMNYLLCGYWKVYHDKETAVKIFETYTKARLAAIEIIKSGGTLKDVREIMGKNYPV